MTRVTYSKNHYKSVNQHPKFTSNQHLKVSNQELAQLKFRVFFLLRCVVKNGVHRFKQLLNLHSIVVKIVQAINILIFLACAVGYRIFRTIR